MFVAVCLFVQDLHSSIIGLLWNHPAQLALCRAMGVTSLASFCYLLKRRTESSRVDGGEIEREAPDNQVEVAHATVTSTGDIARSPQTSGRDGWTDVAERDPVSAGASPATYSVTAAVSTSLGFRMPIVS